MTIKDVPQPQVVCPDPDCKSANLFWHCAQQDERGVYDWGTIVTCDECGLDFSLSTVTPALAAQLSTSSSVIQLPIYGIPSDRYQGLRFQADASVIVDHHVATINFREGRISLTTGTLSFQDVQRIAATITAYIKALRE